MDFYLKRGAVKKFLISMAMLLVLTDYGAAQNPATAQKLIGHWEGAFIRNNAYQKLDIQFYQKDEQLYSLQVMEEWHPVFGEFELPVKVDSVGKISFNTGYGKAQLNLDLNYLEILGQVEGFSPALYIHLKKIPAPPEPNYTVEELTIKNGELSLYGHLHRPKNGPIKTAILLVGGRSCYAGSTKYDLYAKLLREYGIAVLAFHKRGTGKSTGDCSVATIGDLASDVKAWKEYLATHPDQYENIGVLGSSAGGWVMLRTEEETDFDFMISVVGPSTSVRDQQFQSMAYGVDFYKLSPEAKKNVEEYTTLMFDAPATSESFERFQSLLKTAESQKWKQLLDDTDIPPSIEGIDSLWVRRHNYDPGETLKKINRPFLAIYGQRDWVVPYRENIERLNELFGEEHKDKLNTIVAFNAEHGTDTEEKYVTLNDKLSYWHFFRISPQLRLEIISFLKKYDLI